MNETLLYIILGVLYLIFTIIGRVAKKKQQPQPTNESQQPWSLEDTLRDLAGYSEEQPNTAPPPPTDWSDPQITYDTPISNPTPAKLERTPPTSSASNLSRPPLKTPPKQSKIPPSKSTTASKIASQLSNPESAQTAIILGEILGKPKATTGFSRPRLKP